MNVTVSHDLKRVIFKKHAFKEDELSLARCFDFQISKDSKAILCYIDRTTEEALKGFLDHCYRVLMQSPSMHVAKIMLIGCIQQAYSVDKSNFIKEYKPAKFYDLIGKKMWNHQMQTLWMVKNKQYNLCSFEQGLGKTLFAATISQMFNIRRTVIVGPNLVKWNWVMDLSKEWGYDPTVFTVLDRQKTMKALLFEKFIIVNYEMIGNFMDYLTKEDIGHIIIDECHYIKNSRTHRYKEVKKILKAFPKARVTLLTGTPYTNQITDLFAYLKLTKHELGKNFTVFKDKYAKGKSKITGVKNTKDLRLRMSNFMVRRKSDECLDLPPLKIIKYYFEMEDYAAEYKQAMEDLYIQTKLYKDLTDHISYLKKDAESSQNNQQEINSVTQELNQLRTKKSGNLNTLNRLCALSKIPKIIELIKKLNDQDEKVVVFCSYKEPMKRIYEHFGEAAVYIDGSVSAHKRQLAIEKFKKDPKCTVFIGQVIAAGIGINLVNARKVIFCNFPFTPDLLEQPYKRLHRGGQTRPVDVIYTLCKDSVDEHVYNLIKRKIDNINEVIDHGKKGNLDYGTIQERLFNSLIESYEKDNRITESILPQNKLIEIR